MAIHKLPKANSAPAGRGQGPDALPTAESLDRARSAAARMCAAARVLARHVDDADQRRRSLLLSNIEAAEDELRAALRSA